MLHAARQRARNMRNFEVRAWVRPVLRWRNVMGATKPIPPEIPVIPDPQPEIEPDRTPDPEIPPPSRDPVEPPGPDGPEIVPEHSPPEAPPLPPEHVGGAGTN